MKRFICALLAIAAVFICAACSSSLLSPPPAASPAPTAAVGSEPVEVNTAHADRSTVKSAGGAPAAAATAPPPVSTPDTGDFPIVPLAGAVGLILICSAGLLVLRRI